jgi:predicted RNA binding protein YcfA (HicA-like mRNA interferase family)
VAEGFYRDLVKELKRLGYTYSEQAKGSHEKWQAPGRQTLIVPRNLDKRHTANGILKMAGSTKKL